jgi:hypothetical protein
MRGYLNSQAAAALENDPDNQSERVASIKRDGRQQATVFSVSRRPRPGARPSKELAGRHVVVLCGRRVKSWIR